MMDSDCVERLVTAFVCGVLTAGLPLIMLARSLHERIRILTQNQEDGE